ncbi:MAG: FHA domain-containing protein [Chloroflexi bacterium]|nr:FHA domain-containing protein [Chloroflexota bacterium]MCI0578000.1 FHA domain-containing protein [Chloroflexota bacterium]MCI0646971.1 FHA domain-containing protein [Chloroflexota bacterium]MCI0729270.1 FHA domain-containing protein [Chloroflexota bacterium]
MNSAQARLVVRYGPSTKPEFPLPQGTVTLGRESVNDVVLNDPEVSRRHARISFQAGQYIIEDLGSTNGTLVNGQRIHGPTPLRNGDTVDIGESIGMTFYGPASEIEQTFLEPPVGQVETPTMAQYGPGFGRQPAAPQPAAPRYQPQPVQAAPFRPASPYSGPQGSVPPPPQPAGRSPARIVVGCGCLLLLAVFACAASLYLLDLYAPQTLYCGPLRPLFETAGLSLALICP